MFWIRFVLKWGFQFLFSKKNQMAMKLKKKPCPIVKFLSLSYGSGYFFLRHKIYVGFIIQNLEKNTFFECIINQNF
jgi:hypothetical protein